MRYPCGVWTFSHAAAQPFAVTQVHPTDQRLRHPTRRRIEVPVLGGVVKILLSHLTPSHFFDLHTRHPSPQVGPGRPGAVPGIAPVPEGVAVTLGRSAAVSAAVHPAALPLAHSRLLAWCPALGLGMTTGHLAHRHANRFSLPIGTIRSRAPTAP
jgi:hypothetical protein